MSDAADILSESAKLFAERNSVYRDNWRKVGAIMAVLFPEGPPRLETEGDYNRWHLFELAIVKLTRYVTQYNEGGHRDSIEDMIVYLAMVAAIERDARAATVAEVTESLALREMGKDDG